MAWPFFDTFDVSPALGAVDCGDFHAGRIDRNRRRPPVLISHCGYQADGRYETVDKATRRRWMRHGLDVPTGECPLCQLDDAAQAANAIEQALREIDEAAERARRGLAVSAHAESQLNRAARRSGLMVGERARKSESEGAAR